MGLLENIGTTTANLFKVPELRRRILVTLGLLVVYRIGFHVPVPGIDPVRVAEFMRGAGGGLADIVGTFATLSGGSLVSCTLFALGIMPYISAEIIFQLLTKVVPRLEELSKEGDSGRRKIRQYARYTTVGICIVQSWFIVVFLRNQGLIGPEIEAPGQLVAILTLTAGTFFLMWLGEMITEHGIGNGTSLIIMGGIAVDLPKAITQMVEAAQADQTQILPIFIDIAAFLAVTAFVVLFTLGSRRIQIQHARFARGRRVYGGQRSELPLKIMHPGVIPIIFASALLTFPAMMTAPFQSMVEQQSFAGRLLHVIHSEFVRGGFVYVTLYVALIFFFCYFWTKLMFNPVELAKNMKEYGSFIPGFPPGRKTIEYLDTVVNRMTLAGAVVLSLIAISPMILSQMFHLSSQISRFLGGTGILIAVGVALDLVHKIEGQLKMRYYDGFLGHGGPKLKGRRG